MVAFAGDKTCVPFLENLQGTLRSDFWKCFHRWVFILSPIEISGERVRFPFGKTDSRVTSSGILNRFRYIGMDTKVESDSNRIGHEHRSFRRSLLSNSYVQGSTFRKIILHKCRNGVTVPKRFFIKNVPTVVEHSTKLWYL